MTLQVTLLLVAFALLLLSMSVQSSFILGVDGAVLPSMITNGTTTTDVGDTIGLDPGTILNVTAMILNIATSIPPPSPATFIAHGLVFQGALTIMCPASNIAWVELVGEEGGTTTPLLVVITNSSSGGTSPTLLAVTLIKVTGILGKGSNITIRGGIFELNNNFILFELDVTISDNSTFTVTEVVFPLTPATFTRILWCTGSVNITNSSTLALTNNNITVSNIITSSKWPFWLIHFQHSPFATKVISLHLEHVGTLVVSDNRIIISNLTVTGSWELLPISLPRTPLNLLHNSTLSITDNLLQVSNSRCEFWVCHFVYSDIDSPVLISNSSTLTMERNTIEVMDMVVESYTQWFWFVTGAGSPMFVYNSSRISLSHNRMSAHNMSMLIGYSYWAVLYTRENSDITLSGGDSGGVGEDIVDSGSTIDVGHNTMNNSMVSVPTNIWSCSIVYINLNTPVTISTRSTFTINGNVMEVSSDSSGNPSKPSWASIMRSNSAVTINGHVTISDNNVSGVNFMSSPLKLVHFDSTGNGGNDDGILTIANNNIIDGRLATKVFAITFPATISASNLSIRMCPSYMDDMLCRPVGEPVCIYGVVSSDVSWCTNTITRYTASNGTVTSSATPTLSSNGTTQTQSPTFGNTTQSSSHTSSYFPPPCPVAPQPCPYAYTTPVVGNATAGAGASVNVTNSTGCGVGGEGLVTVIPYTVWSSQFVVSVLLDESFGNYFSSPDADSVVSSGTAEGVLDFEVHLLQDIYDRLWAVISLSYVGPVSRSARNVVVDMIISRDRFSCVLGTDSVIIPLHVYLRAADPIPEAISTVVDVAVGIAVISGVPSSLVRAGMMKTVLSMLTCSEFDPHDTLGFLSNPFGWGAGLEVLQYYRGSVATGILLGTALVGCICCAMVAMRVSSGTWTAAVDRLRLPSLPLVFALLTSEMCVSSAVSLIFFKDSVASDIVLGLVFICPFVAYMAVYMVRAVNNTSFINVVATKAVDVRGKSKLHRFLRYGLDPTHDIELQEPAVEEGELSAFTVTPSKRWLRRNFYFVADRRWAAYGAIEVVGGTMMNILEGIPLTTSSRALCIARPACVLIIACGLLVLLMWRTPNAIRAQQWCAVVVMGGMVVTSALATGNAVVPSSTLELSAGYIGVVAVGASMILGLVEMVVILFMYVPQLRDILELRYRALDAVVKRSRKLQAVMGLHVPMLVVNNTPNQTPPNPTQNQPRHIVPTSVPGVAVSTSTNHDSSAPPQQQQQHRPHPPLREDPNQDVIINSILADLDAYEEKQKQKREDDM